MDANAQQDRYRGDAPGSPVDAREIGIVAGLLALALGLRLLWWSRTAVMFADGPRYLAQAGRFASGDFRGGIGSTDHPIYALAVAALRRIEGLSGAAETLWSTPTDWERAGVIVSIACGTAAVGVLYVLLRDLHGRTIAGIGALLLAIHVRAVAWSADVQSDAPYTLLFLCGATLLWRALIRRSPALAGAAGLVGGLAYLTRPEGLAVLVVGGALAGVEGWRARWGAARVLGFVAALGLGAALLIGPYLFALHDVHGRWMLTPKKSLSTLGGGAMRPGPGPVAPAVAPGAPVPLPDFAALPKRPRPDAATSAAALGPAARRSPGIALFDVWIAFVSGLRHELVAFLLIGLAVGRGRPGPRGRFIGAFIALHLCLWIALSISYGYLSTRHMLPPLLLTFGSVALGLRVFGGWLALGPCRVAPSLAGRPALPIALGIAVAVAFSASKHGRLHRPEKAHERGAAVWLQGQPAVGVVAVHRARVAFYAGAPALDLRRIPGRNRLLPVLRSSGVTHLIVDSRARDAHPDLADPDTLGLPLLFRSADARVYAVKRRGGR